MTHPKVTEAIQDAMHRIRCWPADVVARRFQSLADFREYIEVDIEEAKAELAKPTYEEMCAALNAPSSYDEIRLTLMSCASSAQFLGASEKQVNLIARLASEAGDSVHSINGGSGILLARDASLIIESYQRAR